MPPPLWAKSAPAAKLKCRLCFAPHFTAVTDATQPLGLVLESTRDQSVSVLRGEESWPSHSSLSGQGAVAAQGARGKTQARGPESTDTPTGR